LSQLDKVEQHTDDTGDKVSASAQRDSACALGRRRMLPWCCGSRAACLTHRLGLGRRLATFTC